MEYIVSFYFSFESAIEIFISLALSKEKKKYIKISLYLDSRLFQMATRLLELECALAT